MQEHAVDATSEACAANELKRPDGPLATLAKTSRFCVPDFWVTERSRPQLETTETAVLVEVAVEVVVRTEVTVFVAVPVVVA